MQPSEPRRHTPEELMRLPREERERLVEEALIASQNEDFEIFEANDPIYDYDDDEIEHD
jgi:hypothetical protein